MLKSWYDFKIWWVRALTQSEYSHAAIARVDGGRVMVFEAVMPQVRYFPLSKLGDFYWLPSNAPWGDDTLEFAMSKLGEEYSQSQAIQSEFHLPSNDNLWQCAEYARAILMKDGIDAGPKATPSAIGKYRMEQGATCTLVKNCR